MLIYVHSLSVVSVYCIAAAVFFDVNKDYHYDCINCFDAAAWLGGRKGIRPVKN